MLKEFYIQQTIFKKDRQIKTSLDKQELEEFVASRLLTPRNSKQNSLGWRKWYQVETCMYAKE